MKIVFLDAKTIGDDIDIHISELSGHLGPQTRNSLPPLSHPELGATSESKFGSEVLQGDETTEMLPLKGQPRNRPSVLNFLG